MAFCLRMVMAFCLALVLVASPFGAANASNCADGAHMSMMNPGSTPDSVDQDHHRSDLDGAAGRGSQTHGAVLHACCAGMCFGPALGHVEAVPVVVDTVAVARPGDTALPEGLNTAPPLGPPRSTI